MSEKLNDHSSRAHAVLSASSAHRWLACPPSAVAAAGYPNESSPYAKEGTLAHEVAEKAADWRDMAVECRAIYGDLAGYLNLLDDVGDVTQEMIECAIGYADYIQEQIKNDDAVLLLEQRVDFSPWVPHGFGTCDCIILQGDKMTVIDYKYGVGVPVSAENNPQMKLYALGALNDFGIAYDVTHVEMHIYQPRINNISSSCLVVEDLMEWAEKTVKPIAQKAAKGKGDYNAGDHCKFCPHAGRCRQLTKVCTEYVETHSLRAAVPVLAPHEVAEVLAMEPLIALWLKRVKAQALATLLDGGEVPGWKVVEGKLGNRKWADEMKVVEVLFAAGYSQAEITETKLLSPAAMDKALGKKKVAELLEDLVDRSPGAPTVVPVSDKRPAYNRADDFEKLD